MSITPLMSGTPGTRNSTLVAMAVSAVQSKRSADEAHSDATKAERMKMMKWFTPALVNCCRAEKPASVEVKTIPTATQSPLKSLQNEALASPTTMSTNIGSMRGFAVSLRNFSRITSSGSRRSTASQLSELRSELRSKLIGRAGIFTTRVTASPVASSRTVRIVLFWKLDS